MIFSIGDNTYGQLGINENDKTKEVSEAIMLKDLLNFRIMDIIAGSKHCMCFGGVREIAKNGVTSSSVEYDPNKPHYLFAWGDNSFYQLGLKKINNKNNCYLKPTKVPLNKNSIYNPNIIGDKLITFGSGINFNVVLFESGKLFTFGDNQYNQIIKKENEYIANEVSKYIPSEYGKIIKIFIAANSLMLITDKRKVFIFGKFNENYSNINIFDLVEDYNKLRFILTDKLLKIIVYDQEKKNNSVINNYKIENIDKILVNLKTEEIKSNSNENTNLTTVNENKNNIVNISNTSSSINNNPKINKKLPEVKKLNNNNDYISKNSKSTVNTNSNQNSDSNNSNNNSSTNISNNSNNAYNKYNQKNNEKNITENKEIKVINSNGEINKNQNETYKNNINNSVYISNKKPNEIIPNDNLKRQIQKEEPIDNLKSFKKNDNNYNDNKDNNIEININKNLTFNNKNKDNNDENNNGDNCPYFLTKKDIPKCNFQSQVKNKYNDRYNDGNNDTENDLSSIQNSQIKTSVISKNEEKPITSQKITQKIENKNTNDNNNNYNKITKETQNVETQAKIKNGNNKTTTLTSNDKTDNILNNPSENDKTSKNVTINLISINQKNIGVSNINKNTTPNNYIP